MNGGVGDERYREQRLRRRQPEVAHYHHHGVVVDVEEGEPAGAGSTEDDQKGIYKFENLGKIEDVGPEKCGSARRSVVGRKTHHPSPVVVGHLVDGGEGAANGHDEGEEAEDKVVRGGDEAEGSGGEGREQGELVEGESDGEVRDDGDGEKKWGGA